MEKDNATEKAYKIGQCKECGDKIWFWKIICHKCFLNLYNIFIKSY